ncbi:hypothetical protein T01_10892 [Trichinella spiralis]|uniref:Uncharacterized protein n=1 Tax=Trichinella spiralis TaxID=6334 RepID=A0A0V1AHF3_TRISP|nr:hypothetical protein T01_10892 [Trichinella spiralis]
MTTFFKLDQDQVQEISIVRLAQLKSRHLLRLHSTFK